MSTSDDRATGCGIEIIERCATANPLGVVAPNEVRINGHPVLADENITIHETEIIGGRSRDVVRVTLTLFARRVRIEAQPEGGDA